MPLDLLPRLAVALFEELRVDGFDDVFAEPDLLVDLEPLAVDPDLAVVFEDFALEALDLLPVPELRELDAFDFEAVDFDPALDADAFDPDLAAEAFVADFAEEALVPDFAEEVFDPDFAAVGDLDEALFRAVD